MDGGENELGGNDNENAFGDFGSKGSDVKDRLEKKKELVKEFDDSMGSIVIPKREEKNQKKDFKRAELPKEVKAVEKDDSVERKKEEKKNEKIKLREKKSPQREKKVKKKNESFKKKVGRAFRPISARFTGLKFGKNENGSRPKSVALFQGMFKKGDGKALGRNENRKKRMHHHVRVTSTIEFNANKKLRTLSPADIKFDDKVIHEDDQILVRTGRKRSFNVAVKFFKFIKNVDDAENLTIYSFNHPCLLKCFGTYADKSVKPYKIGIVIDYCVNKDIVSYFNTCKNKWRFEDIVNLLKQVSGVIEFLHSKNIIIKELKSKSILLTKSCQPKLNIYALSNLFEKDSEHYSLQGKTTHYKAPEIILAKGFNAKCDSYSFGFIMWELFYNNFEPFKNIKNIDIILATSKDLRPEVDLENVEDNQLWYIELMLKCLEFDPVDRPSFKEINNILLKKKKKMLFQNFTKTVGVNVSATRDQILKKIQRSNIIVNQKDDTDEETESEGETDQEEEQENVGKEEVKKKKRGIFKSVQENVDLGNIPLGKINLFDDASEKGEGKKTTFVKKDEQIVTKVKKVEKNVKKLDIPTFDESIQEDETEFTPLPSEKQDFEKKDEKNGKNDVGESNESIQKDGGNLKLVVVKEEAVETRAKLKESLKVKKKKPVSISKKKEYTKNNGKVKVEMPKDYYKRDFYRQKELEEERKLEEEIKKRKKEEEERERERKKKIEEKNEEAKKLKMSEEERKREEDYNKIKILNVIKKKKKKNVIDYDGFGDLQVDFKDGRYEGNTLLKKGTFYLHGKGKYVYANKALYEGEYYKNKREGKGVYTFPNGDKYSGEFSSNLPDGYGEYNFADGSRYIGFIRMAIFTPKGTFYHKNGNKFEGEYKNGKEQGIGRIIYKDKTYKEFVGTFKNGNIHGKGIFTENDNSMWYGITKNGKKFKEYMKHILDKVRLGKYYAEVMKKSKDFTFAKYYSLNENEIETLLEDLFEVEKERKKVRLEILKGQRKINQLHKRLRLLFMQK